MRPGKGAAAFVLAGIALALSPALAGAGFQPLGDPLNDAASQVFSVNIVDDAGQPLVVWDNSPPTGLPIQVHAKRFDGTSWVAAGGVLNVDATRSAYESSLAMVIGTPFAAFKQIDSSSVSPHYHLYVRSFDGASWNTVGGELNIDTTHDANEPDIASIGNGLEIGSIGPWVAWTEFTGTQGHFAIHVKKRDSGNWVEVGSSPSDPVMAAGSPVLTQTTSGLNQFTPYLAWSELDANATSPVSHVKLTHGAFGGWVTPPIDLAVNPGRSAAAPTLATVAGRPYVAWIEDNGTALQLRARRFDGQNFESTGGSLNVDPTQNAGQPQLANIGGVPYLAWSEGNGLNNKLYLRRFDGTNWVLVGGPLNRDPSKYAFGPDLADFEGIPYAAWQEKGPQVVVSREVPPTCSDSSVSVPHDAAAGVTLGCSDGARSVVAGPGQGAVSGLDQATGGATYTPTPGFAGADSFTFKSNDGMFDSNVATVSLDVLAATPVLPTLAQISQLKQSASTFAVAKAATPKTGQAAAKRHPKGTTFSFALDQPATITIAISRVLAGRRVGRKCKAPTHALRRKPACTRLRKAGTLTRGGHAGLNRIRFTGRIGRKALKRGRYRASFTATDTAGTSRPAALRFRIVKR